MILHYLKHRRKKTVLLKKFPPWKKWKQVVQLAE